MKLQYAKLWINLGALVSMNCILTPLTRCASSGIEEEFEVGTGNILPRTVTSHGEGNLLNVK
jgi:hypothetical protein